MATMTSDHDRDASQRLTCRVTRVSDSPHGDMVYRVDVLFGCGGQVVHCDHIVYPAGSPGYRVDDGERVVLQFAESCDGGEAVVPVVRKTGD